MCRVLNIISTESYVRANTEFIKLTNLSIATYTEMLFTILNAVSKKKTYDSNTGIFKVDRAYITDRTGISLEDQKEYDLTLYKLGIIGTIDPTNKNKISLNAKRYFEILSDPETVPADLVTKTAKMTHADKQAAKVAGIQAGIVALFNETDERAIAAVQKLVDVYYSKGYVKHVQWEPIVKTLHACTGGDPKALVEITEFIVASNWQSINSAIDVFMQKHAGNATKLKTTQKKCEGTSDTVF